MLHSWVRYSLANVLASQAVHPSVVDILVPALTEASRPLSSYRDYVWHVKLLVGATGLNYLY